MGVRDVILSNRFDRFEDEVLRFTPECVRPVVVADAAKLTIEVAAGAQGELVLLHSVACEVAVHVVLSEGASLSVTQVFEAEAFVELSVTQAAHSVCTCVVVQLTSSNAVYSFALNGCDAECNLSGVFLAAGQEHCETSVRVSHNVPDCRSNSLVKGVAGGCATGVFCGLVYVAQDAQRTDARQQSRNILLGETARIITQPQLEIYADDVKCAHGATVGQMNTDAVLYMRQRGLSEAQARTLQIEGFVGDVVSRCAAESLREALTDALAQKLHTM